MPPLTALRVAQMRAYFWSSHLAISRSNGRQSKPRRPRPGRPRRDATASSCRTGKHRELPTIGGSRIRKFSRSPQVGTRSFSQNWWKKWFKVNNQSPRPGAGRKPVALALGPIKTPRDFLTALMRNDAAPIADRFKAALKLLNLQGDGAASRKATIGLISRKQKPPVGGPASTPLGLSRQGRGHQDRHHERQEGQRRWRRRRIIHHRHHFLNRIAYAHAGNKNTPSGPGGLCVVTHRRLCLHHAPTSPSSAPNSPSTWQFETNPPNHAFSSCAWSLRTCDRMQLVFW